MIKTLARCDVKKDRIETFKEVAYKLIDATRTNEPDNIKYELFQDIYDETVFFFVEEWKDEDALKRHHKTAHVGEFGPQLGPNLKEQMVINVLKFDK